MQKDDNEMLRMIFSSCCRRPKASTSTLHKLCTTALCEFSVGLEEMKSDVDQESSNASLEIDRRLYLNSCEENPSHIDNALRQLGEAITRLPAEVSAAYCSAIEKCPELVESESDPLKFLRSCDYDTEEAADRLASYWKLRAEIFGKERCYKPVSLLSDKGALSSKAQKIVDLGVAYLLPNDNFGRVILYFNRANLSAKVKSTLGVALPDKLQASFYHLQLVADQSKSATNGFILVHVITEKQPKANPKLQEFFSRAARKCFPIKMKGFHIVCCPHLNLQQKKIRFADKFLPFLWQLLSQFFNFTKRSVDLIMVETPLGATKKVQQQDLARVLTSKLGLDTGGLPPEAGGPWSYSQFKQSEMAMSLPKTNIQSCEVPTKTKHFDDELFSPLDLLAAAADGDFVNREETIVQRDRNGACSTNKRARVA